MNNLALVGLKEEEKDYQYNFTNTKNSSAVGLHPNNNNYNNNSASSSSSVSPLSTSSASSSNGGTSISSSYPTSSSSLVGSYPSHQTGHDSSYLASSAVNYFIERKHNLMLFNQQNYFEASPHRLHHHHHHHHNHHLYNHHQLNELHSAQNLDYPASANLLNNSNNNATSNMLNGGLIMNDSSLLTFQPNISHSHSSAHNLQLNTNNPNCTIDYNHDLLIQSAVTAAAVASTNRLKSSENEGLLNGDQQQNQNSDFSSVSTNLSNATNSGTNSNEIQRGTYQNCKLNNTTLNSSSPVSCSTSSSSAISPTTSAISNGGIVDNDEQQTSSLPISNSSTTPSNISNSNSSTSSSSSSSSSTSDSLSSNTSSSNATNELQANSLNDTKNILNTIDDSSSSSSGSSSYVNNSDSNLIPLNDNSYSTNHHQHNQHGYRNDLGFSLNGQHINPNFYLNSNQPNSDFQNGDYNSNSLNSRLSACFKYASTSDQLQMAAAAAAAVAAAAVVTNSANNLMSAPASTASSSSSISMDEILDGSSPSSHHQLSNNGSNTAGLNQIGTSSAMQRPFINNSSYSPNHLMGFYNNNLLENAYYKNSSAINCLNSSSSSSSFGGYQIQNQNVNPIDSEYFNNYNSVNNLASQHSDSSNNSHLLAAAAGYSFGSSSPTSHLRQNSLIMSHPTNSTSHLQANNLHNSNSSISGQQTTHLGQNQNSQFVQGSGFNNPIANSSSFNMPPSSSSSSSSSSFSSSSSSSSSASSSSSSASSTSTPSSSSTSSSSSSNPTSSTSSSSSSTPSSSISTANTRRCSLESNPIYNNGSYNSKNMLQSSKALGVNNSSSLQSSSSVSSSTINGSNSNSNGNNFNSLSGFDQHHHQTNCHSLSKFQKSNIHQQNHGNSNQNQQPNSGNRFSITGLSASNSSNLPSSSSSTSSLALQSNSTHNNHLNHHVLSASNGHSSSVVSSPHDAVPPNQLCAVCGDNAACQHYGVRTCEGCKGFFKRTVQKNSKYVCLAEKNCPVDKRRRNRCQYCRFQKCLAVGMVKEVVRTNDLKGRRGRLPTKPKSPNNQTGNRTQQSTILSQIVRVFTDTVPNQAVLDFSRYRKITKETIKIDDEPSWVLQSLARSCEIVRQWADKFCTLFGACIPNSERDRMFFTNLLDLVVLRIALRMQDNVERIIMCNAAVFHRTQLAYVLTSPLLQQIQDLANKLKQPDPAISSLLVALVFLQDPQQVQMNELYCKMRELLKEFSHQLQQQQQQKQMNSQIDQQQVPNYFSQLTDLFIQLRQISMQLKLRLKQCNMYNNSIYPSCIPTNSILDLYLQSQDQNPQINMNQSQSFKIEPINTLNSNQNPQQHHNQIPTTQMTLPIHHNHQHIFNFQQNHQQLSQQAQHEISVHEFN